jgi:hypothetical protein
MRVRTLRAVIHQNDSMILHESGRLAAGAQILTLEGGDADRDPGSMASESSEGTPQLITPLRPPNFYLTPKNEPRKPKLVCLIPGPAK